MWKDEKRLNQDLTQLPIQWDKIPIKPFMIKLIVDCQNAPYQEEKSWSRKKSGGSNANFWTQLHFARECGGIFSGISFSIKLSGTLAPLRRRGGDVFAQPFIFCALATGKPLLLGMEISLWEASFLFLTSKQTNYLIASYAIVALQFFSCWIRLALLFDVPLEKLSQVMLMISRTKSFKFICSKFTKKCYLHCT